LKESSFGMRNGISVFAAQAAGINSNLEIVNAILDEEECRAQR